MPLGRYRELSLNTVLFAISTFGSKIVSFFLLPLYTSVLSTADYGSVDFMVSIITLLVPLLTFNIQDAVLRFGLSEDSRPEEVLAVGLRSIGFGSAVLFAVLIIIGFAGVAPFGSTYLVFLFVMFFLTSTANVLTMYAKSRDRIRPLVVSGIGGTLVQCVVAITLLLWARVGVLGYMAALASGSLFTVVWLIFTDGVSISAFKVLRPGLHRAMIAYSLPLVANSLAWWVNDVSGRWVVTLLCGVAANGIYAVAFKIPSILSMLQTVFYNAWSISAIKEFDQNDSDGFLGKTYEMYSVAMSLCCSVIMMLNIPLATLLYSNDFFAAWHYVPLLLVGVRLNGLALFEGCIFAAAKQTRAVSVTTVAGAVIGIGSCFVLTGAFGPVGTAASTVIGYLVTWGVRTHQMVTKVAKIKVNWWVEAVSLGILIMQALFAMREGLQLIQLLFFVVLILIQGGRLKGMVSSVLGMVRGR